MIAYPFVSYLFSPKIQSSPLPATTTVYAYGPSGLLSKQSGGETSYYHTDSLSSSALVTDKEGKVVYRSDYEPFGDSLHTSGEERYTYTGKERDVSTGLYYYGARYYDSALGRFISSDPISGNLYNSQRLNRYTYVMNNPMVYTDPTGMESTRANAFLFVGPPGPNKAEYNGLYNSFVQSATYLAAYATSLGGGNSELLPKEPLQLYGIEVLITHQFSYLSDFIDFLESASSRDVAYIISHSSREESVVRATLDISGGLEDSKILSSIDLWYNEKTGHYLIEQTDMILGVSGDVNLRENLDYLLENDALIYDVSVLAEGTTDASLEVYGCGLVNCGSVYPGGLEFMIDQKTLWDRSYGEARDLLNNEILSGNEKLGSFD